MNIRYPIYEGVYRILTDKTGLKAIRKEKINRFSPVLTCARP